MIEQLFMTLDTTYQQVQENDEDPSKHSDIKSKIEDTLQGPKSWRTAYRIEQLMVPLLKGEIFEIALSRDILRAKELGQDVTRYYEDQVEAATTDRSKQALLEKLIQDLQWHHEISHIRWSHINKVWAIVTYVFIASFLLFFLTDLIPMTGSYLNEIRKSGSMDVDIFTATTAGALGASFSMLIGLKHRLEVMSLHSLEAMRKTRYVFSRVATGIRRQFNILLLFTIGVVTRFAISGIHGNRV